MALGVYRCWQQQRAIAAKISKQHLAWQRSMAYERGSAHSASLAAASSVARRSWHISMAHINMA